MWVHSMVQSAQADHLLLHKLHGWLHPYEQFGTLKQRGAEQENTHRDGGPQGVSINIF